MNTLKKLKRRIQYLFVKRGWANEIKHAWLVRKCYTDMYACADADFDRMVRESPLNKMGQIDIPFNDYIITRKEYYDILSFYQSFLKENYYRQGLANQINLGCSPKHD